GGGASLLAPVGVSVAAAAGGGRGATGRAAFPPPGKERETGVPRRYLGVEGKPVRYLIIAIPPRQPQAPPPSREPLAACIARHLMAGARTRAPSPRPFRPATSRPAPGGVNSAARGWSPWARTVVCRCAAGARVTPAAVTPFR